MFQSIRSKINDLSLKVGVAVVAAVPAAAMAQGDPFTAAMTEATGKVTTYAGALVTLGAVAVVFMIGLKYVKKIVRAA